MGPLGPRRRARRRGLIAGAAIGSAMSRKGQNDDTAEEAPATPGEDDKIKQLEDLGRLRDQGILTEEEFAAQKAKILG
jgi:hypothetical protein